MEPRPDTLFGTTTKIQTGCGSLYVTINKNGSKPIEVMAHLGHTGGCSACQNEALTRSITLGLRYGVPVDELTDQLRGIQCPNPNLWPKESRTLSCPDAIARVLKEFADALQRDS